MTEVTVNVVTVTVVIVTVCKVTIVTVASKDSDTQGFQKGGLGEHLSPANLEFVLPLSGWDKSQA